MDLSRITQYTALEQNVHISDVLWDMRQVRCAICEIGLLTMYDLKLSLSIVYAAN